MNNQILESIHKGIRPGRTRCKQCGVLKNNKIKNDLADKEIKKIIYVKGRILNFVV